MKHDYVEGMMHPVQFGSFEKGQQRARLTLYGDINHSSAPFAMQAAGYVEHPDQACLTDHQKCCLYFEFGQLRPYGQLLEFFDRLAQLVTRHGWQLAPLIEGTLDIGGLVDTNNPSFMGHDQFPESPDFQGYNAADSISLVVEKPETNPVFSSDEIESLCQLMCECMQIVFGKELPVYYKG